MEEELQRRAYQLPKVEAPSLDDLRVEVESPPAPTAEELIDRLHSRLRESSPRRERKAGEPIEEGDEVECDLVTLVDGRVVPGGVMGSARMEVREFLHLPGLLEELLSMTTFSAKTFELTLPQAYPIPSVAGHKATVFVEARRVFQVDPFSMDDANALKAAGLGENVEAAMEAIAAEIDAEQGQELLVQATQTVLDALGRRIEAEVPAAAIDEELRQSWLRGEGAVLGSKSLPPELVSQAEGEFIRNPRHRAEAEQRIKVGLALGALVEKEGLAPTADTMTMLLETAAEQSGTTVGQAKAALKAEPAYAMQAGQTALYLNAVEFVMSRAKVDVLEPSDPEA